MSRLAAYALPFMMFLVFTGQDCGGGDGGGSYVQLPPPPPPVAGAPVQPAASPAQTLVTPRRSGSPSASAGSGPVTQAAAGPFSGQAGGSRQDGTGTPPGPGETTTDGVYVPPIGPVHVVTSETAQPPGKAADHRIAENFPTSGLSDPSLDRSRSLEAGEGLGALAVNGTIAPIRPAEDGRSWKTTQEFDALARQADGRFRMRDYAGLRQDAEDLRDMQPANPRGHVLLAESLNGLGKYKEAEQAALDALQKDPDNAQGYQMRAWAQLGQGKATDALRNAERALALDPNDARGYFIRALAYEALGKSELMLADLRKAAQLDPSYKIYLGKVVAGGKLFGVNAHDNEALMDSLPRGRASRLPWVLLGLAVLAAAAAAAASLRRRLLRRGLPRTQRFKLDLDGSAGQSPPVMVREAAGPAGERQDDGLLAGKYRMTRVIGQGGMGQVWEAKDRSLDRLVAVKKMAGGAGLSSASARELFLKEARTLAALHHPNIVDIYEVLDHPSGVFLVFEFVNGKTLQQILAEKKSLPLKVAASILRPVCAALQFAHEKGIAHRDLKPANIMVARQGMVKVMDFGLARRTGEAAPSGSESGATPPSGRTQTIAGTPAYMAPEAMDGTVTPQSDVYALGICLYEMLTGEKPCGDQPVWRAPSHPKASARSRAVPAEADALIEAALEPKLSARLRSAKEFSARLAAAGPAGAAAPGR